MKIGDRYIKMINEIFPAKPTILRKIKKDIALSITKEVENPELEQKQTSVGNNKVKPKPQRKAAIKKVAQTVSLPVNLYCDENFERIDSNLPAASPMKRHEGALLLTNFHQTLARKKLKESVRNNILKNTNITVQIIPTKFNLI